MIVQENGSVVWSLAQKLGAWFKEGKSTILEEFKADPNSLLLKSATLNERHDFRHLFYCASVNKLNIMDLLSYFKFIKTDIVEHFLLAEGAVSPNQKHLVILALGITGTLWTVRRGISYSGVGGILVRDPQVRDSGFILEPLEHLLATYYPKPEAG